MEEEDKESRAQWIYNPSMNVKENNKIRGKLFFVSAERIIKTRGSSGENGIDVFSSGKASTSHQQARSREQFL